MGMRVKPPRMFYLSFSFSLAFLGKVRPGARTRTGTGRIIILAWLELTVGDRGLDLQPL